MPYLAIKHTHILLAVVTLLVFIVRGVMLMRRSPSVNAKLFRVLPHVLYTLLILAGATLATLSGQWGQTWIWLKLALLVVFVGLGVVVFRTGGTLPLSRRASIWGMALLIYIMIFAVAAHHHARMAIPAAAADAPKGV